MIDLVMDRNNMVAPGWSHVLSLTDDVRALDLFRIRIGAPLSALQLPPKASRPHLDIKQGPRRRALELDGIAVTVYDRSTDMMRAARAALTCTAGSEAAGGEHA